uniref:Uncharacterized protein n=1 Tax=Schistocephalus solidus TaxID=70667 RepID=A0A0X3PPW6_SCHSO
MQHVRSKPVQSRDTYTCRVGVTILRLKPVDRRELPLYMTKAGFKHTDPVRKPTCNQMERQKSLFPMSIERRYLFIFYLQILRIIKIRKRLSRSVTFIFCKPTQRFH